MGQERLRIRQEEETEKDWGAITEKKRRGRSDGNLLFLFSRWHPSFYFNFSFFSLLELHLVDLVTLGKTERSLEVLGQVVNLLDGGENGSIHILLSLLVVIGKELLLLVTVEELGLLGLVGLLVSLEVGVVDRLGERDRRDVNLGGGGNNVSLGDTSEGDTVESEKE